MIFFSRSLRYPVLGLILAVFVGVGVASAQDYGSMGISDVVGNADAMLQKGDYAGAIPALEEVIRRTKDLTDPQGLETLQSCRFQLARAFYQRDQTDAGMQVLGDYLKQSPRKQEAMALRMMAQGYFDKGEWNKIEEVAGRLLAMPKLPPEDQLVANLLLGQAEFRQNKWKECIPPLSYVSSNAKDERTRNLTQIMVIRALVESEDWSELFSQIPRLYRTDAKYDITLNLTLMRAGKARFEQSDFIHALLLYRMVLPRGELIGYSTRRVDALSKKLAADVKIGITESERVDRQKEIDEIKDSQKVLTDLPAYEDEVTFRIGQIYADVKRYWEGYVLFDRLYQQDRNSDIGEASMLQSVLILYDVKEVDRAEERILLYINEKPGGQYARTLLSMMMRDNLVKQHIEKVIGLRKYVEAMPATQSPDELQLQADMHYVLAFAYLQNKDYALAGDQFGIILTRYPNSSNLPDARYYRGMSYMLQGNYPDALADFKSYQSQYLGGEHYGASMFREGVCLFGMEKIPQAEIAFTGFIDTYPDDSLLSEAYSMRGDIEAAKDGSDNPNTPENEYDPHTLDRALADYRKAIDKATLPTQAAYAVFQAAKVYKLEFKWQEIVDLMNYYMNLLEDKADVAQAVFWIGQSQIEMGQVNEAVSAYLNAIERYGNEVEQEGIDKIIMEVVQIARDYLSEEDRADMLLKLKFKLNAVPLKDEVLQLRLRAAIAQLEGPEAVGALGNELLSITNLVSMTPVSLAIMCDAAVAGGKPAEMTRIYTYFMEHFEESDLLWHAYRAKTFQKLAENDNDAVLKVIEDAQGLFGAESFMGWAQIIRADTLYKMKKYDEAQEAYNMVMGVPEWRGSLCAEAMYGMGRCRLALDDYATAHTFFQRTYLQYKAYDDGKWAADGYLAAADSLVKLGRPADVVNTLTAMLADPYVNTLPQAEKAREMIKKYKGA
ncbi:MAG: tetratricopeptide repeat protein [Kiritimatiellales bacterium]|nr:tetratricopeptide repeat protein [Kiritimatiellales bacterium]